MNTPKQIELHTRANENRTVPQEVNRCFRTFTDSRSTLDGACEKAGCFDKYMFSIRILYPGHYGIEKNERVEGLAKQLQAPLEKQAKVDNDLIDTKALIKVNQKIIRLLPERYEAQLSIEESQ